MIAIFFEKCFPSKHPRCPARWLSREHSSLYSQCLQYPHLSDFESNLWFIYLFIYFSYLLISPCPCRSSHISSSSPELSLTIPPSQTPDSLFSQIPDPLPVPQSAELSVIPTGGRGSPHLTSTSFPGKIQTRSRADRTRTDNKARASFPTFYFF